MYEMLRFTFKSKDLLDGIIQREDDTTRYITSTTSGLRGRKVTSIIHNSPSSLSDGYVAAAINWKDGVFDIGGLQRPMAMLKHKSGGFFGSEREWTWLAERYVIKFGGDRWTATRKSDNKTCAVFNLRRSHFFRDSEHATITVSADVPAEDVVFLVMVMIYSETKHEDRRRESRNEVAANEAWAASTPSVVNASNAQVASLAASIY